MNNKTTTGLPQLPVNELALADLGLGEVAYVRQLPVNRVEQMLGAPLGTDPSKVFFCLYMANGTPVSVSESREAAIANAFEHDLATISVH
ncbi:MAG: DUF1150 family protein [Anderseniella sp.]